MAVDANVLVFEQIREELKTAKPSATGLGYEKALSAIIDANVTTFITAVILFALGSGPVRGSPSRWASTSTSVFTPNWRACWSSFGLSAAAPRRSRSDPCV